VSQENVEVARRWVELFNTRDDVDEFLSLHDPEVELQAGLGCTGMANCAVGLRRNMRTFNHASSRSAS
jgi:hypothetical protein